MAAFESRVDTEAQEFRLNAETNRALAELLQVVRTEEVSFLGLPEGGILVKPSGKDKEEAVYPLAERLATFRRRGELMTSVADLALVPGDHVTLYWQADRLIAVLVARARAEADTTMMGRTHSVHAEPTTFGLKLAGWAFELDRGRVRLVRALEGLRVGKLSGAVGTYAATDPEVERIACERLGLEPAPSSTQILQRDRHADLLAALALVAASLEKFALEIRHLARTEVAEVQEPFGHGQKGSSAMPHKRNPIVSERICGLARVVRAAAVVGLENVALWHERDISHSSVERFIGPDATITLDFALVRAASLIEKLVVYPDRMRANLERAGGLVHSGRVLLAFTQKGVSREDAYRLVQKSAMRAFKGEGGLKDLLKADSEVTRWLKPAEIEELFDLEYHFKEVDTIFARVFGELHR